MVCQCSTREGCSKRHSRLFARKSKCHPPLVDRSSNLHSPLFARSSRLHSPLFARSSKDQPPARSWRRTASGAGPGTKASSLVSRCGRVCSTTQRVTGSRYAHTGWRVPEIPSHDPWQTPISARYCYVAATTVLLCPSHQTPVERIRHI